MTGSAQVAVTGTGAVSALGGNVEATWHGILDGRTAVRHWADLSDEGFSLDVACRVDDAVWGDDDVTDERERGRATEPIMCASRSAAVRSITRCRGCSPASARSRAAVTISSSVAP